MPAGSLGIGTLRERPLHASLKRWYAQPGDREESPIDGFVIDLVRGDLLIEIQTRGFATMKAKVIALLARGHRLRIVHPIAVDRWIVSHDTDGTVLHRRRSPRHGDLIDLVIELVSLPNVLADPRFEIGVLLIAEEEHRRHEPGRCWRRRGWTTTERHLLEVVDRVVVARPEDLAGLMRAGLPERFTAAELAIRLAKPRRLAQQLAYCLRGAGVIDVVGRRSRALEYCVASGVRLDGIDAVQ